MVIASVKSTDGKGLPKEMGDPRSLIGLPLRVTPSPGCAVAVSIGVSGRVVAHAKTPNIVKANKIVKPFLYAIKIPPSFNPRISLHAHGHKDELTGCIELPRNEDLLLAWLCRNPAEIRLCRNDFGFSAILFPSLCSLQVDGRDHQVNTHP